jgi:hypothetical protein
MSEEEWRPVAHPSGLADVYEISSWGRLRRKTDSLSKRYKAGSFIRGTKTLTGHLIADLYDGQGRYAGAVFIHRLVLYAFVGPLPEGMEACHNDGNPANNRVENLRWDTRKSNVADRTDGYVNHRGEKSGRAKLTNEIASLIRKDGRSLRALAKVYNVNYTTISKIRRNQSYRDA